MSASVFEAKNTRPISPRCHHSAPVSLGTLTSQCCTSGPLQKVTSDPTPQPFQACQTHQMDMHPAGIREPVIYGKAIQGTFSRNSSGAAVLCIMSEKEEYHG